MTSNNATGSTVLQGPINFLDLPGEMRNAVFDHLIPSGDVVPWTMWRDVNSLADAHSQLRDEIAVWAWLNDLFGRTIHLLPSDLGSGYFYNRLRPHHLNSLRYLHIETGTFGEIFGTRNGRSFWDVMHNGCSRLRSLTIDIRHTDQSLYASLADLAILPLISTAGPRQGRLRPYLILHVTVAPIRSRRQSTDIVNALSASFRCAIQQGQDLLSPRTMQIPLELRTIEMNMRITDGERQRLAAQYFPRLRGLVPWRWDTVAEPQEDTFRMTWIDGRADGQREDEFDCEFRT